MNKKSGSILSINGGSSSIKFSLHTMDESPRPLVSGEIDSIGPGHTKFNFHHNGSNQNSSLHIDAVNPEEAAVFLLNWLDRLEHYDPVIAIGHRIVHGMERTEPAIVNAELLNELKDISGFDPDHLPAAIRLVELTGSHYPGLIQIACFDTSFHTSMTHAAKLLAIPRRLYNKGVKRYGFHGLSYAYLLEELRQSFGNQTAQGRIIMAHLGSGASLAAIKNGKSVDTSMAFTPSSGLPMGTRSGDIDPGIAWYLMHFEKLDATSFNHLINHQSGLLGVSETSADIRKLMELKEEDSRAADAIEMFCYQTKKWIGSFAAVLGGVDTLVFTGGIGENSPEIRSRICNNLGFLGIEVDEIKNLRNAGVISAFNAKVTVRVIKTNEELMIARLVSKVLHYQLTE